jgi:hypothetical protein
VILAYGFTKLRRRADGGDSINPRQLKAGDVFACLLFGLDDRNDVIEVTASGVRFNALGVSRPMFWTWHRHWWNHCKLVEK